MIKKKLKSMKGITLTSLAIAILVILILTGVTVYNLEGGLKLEKLEKLQSDISNLRGKISNYYMQYGEIPAKIMVKIMNM